MNRFRILIPTSITKNPFIFQLIRALQIHQNVEVVQYGLRWLDDTKFRFDIILIQWPEVLLDWKEPQLKDIQNLKKTIARWKEQNTKIIATVHNNFPHKSVNNYSYDLYNLVYNNCDAMVHMGEESKNILRETVKYSLDPNREYIIPHGNYEWFQNDVSKNEAREYLNVNCERLILSVGTIRNKQELSLLRKVGKMLKSYNCNLLVSSKLPSRIKEPLSYIKTRLYLSSRNITIDEGYIPDHKMKYYLNAADGLFIPRVNSLNSGSVSLGFTFGKIVIGPNFGVIGEDLRKLNNPVFDYKSDDSIKQAIELFFHMLGTDAGKKNKIYALDKLNWTRIANMYVDVFKKTLKG